MIQGVDERQCGGAIESPSVIQGSCNPHRSLIDIGNAKIDFSHDEAGPLRCATRKGGYVRQPSVSAVCKH